MNSKTLSIIFFVLSLVFYVIVFGLLASKKEEDFPGTTKLALSMCVVCSIIAAGMGASYKKESGPLSNQEYINLTIIGLSTILVATGFYKDSGYFLIETALIVGLLASASVIWGN